MLALATGGRTFATHAESHSAMGFAAFLLKILPPEGFLRLGAGEKCDNPTLHKRPASG